MCVYRNKNLNRSQSAPLMPINACHKSYNTIVNVSQSSVQIGHSVSSSSSATAASTASVALTESHRARLVAERLAEAQNDDGTTISSGEIASESSGDVNSVVKVAATKVVQTLTVSPAYRVIADVLQATQKGSSISEATPVLTTTENESATAGVAHVDVEVEDRVKQVEANDEAEEDNMVECPLCLDEYERDSMIAIRGDLFCKDCLATDMVTKIRAGQAPTSPSDDGPISPTLVASVLATRCTLCDTEKIEDADKLVMLV